MVKKLIVFLFVVGMGIGSLSAQLAKTCFTNMPDSLSPLLTAVNRADFIDFLESEMKAEVTNRFGGKSEMTELTPDYIRVPASDTVDVYRYQDARLQADMLLMKADLSGKDATLTFTFTTPDYMEKEAAEKLKSFLRAPITYTWKEGKFNN